MSTLSELIKSLLHYMRIGDWITLLVGSAVTVLLFQTLWQHETAAKVQVRVGDQVFATYDLNLHRELRLNGALGETVIVIADGKVRFKTSPCQNQYCVHQGWLTRNGQVAICLPNHVSLELIGSKKPFDTLNY